MQKEFLFKSNPKQDISDEVILNLPTFKDALRLCKNVSGLDDKLLAMELDIDPAQWSRIWSNGAHFPTEKLKTFMELCGNLIPLRWLSLSFGFELKPLKSALEVELENEKTRTAELETKLKYFEELMAKINK